MTQTNSDKPACLYCHQDSDTLPLIRLQYRDENLWICPQHFPILIHNPAMLIGILPGAENLKEAEHHDE
jgi:hypothetical protein